MSLNQSFISDLLEYSRWSQRTTYSTTPAAVKANENKQLVPFRAMKTFIRNKMRHTT